MHALCLVAGGISAENSPLTRYARINGKVWPSTCLRHLVWLSDPLECPKCRCVFNLL